MHLKTHLDAEALDHQNIGVLVLVKVATIMSRTETRAVSASSTTKHDALVMQCKIPTCFSGVPASTDTVRVSD